MDNTLYYTLSAIPQVLGAIAAVLTAVIHFRIQNLKELLIGDGKSVLNRWGNHGYKFDDPHENQKQEKKLRDAIDRKSITGINDVILLLRDNEKKQGYSKQYIVNMDLKKYRPTGLQNLYEDRFYPTERYLKKLKRFFIGFIAFSFTTIIASIVFLALTDSIYKSNLKCWALWINVGLFIASLIVAFFLMRYGMSDKTAHEIYIPQKETI